MILGFTCPLPIDFQARVRYTTTKTKGLRSIGMSFDVAEQARHWQAIYTHTNSTGSAVHFFHRQNGRDHYTGDAIVDHPIAVDETITLDFAVRGSMINIWINGQLKLAYSMPLARQTGKFQLWCHEGTATFDEVRIERLRDEFQLGEPGGNKRQIVQVRSPFEQPTKADYDRDLLAAQRALELSQLVRDSKASQQSALTARIAADEAKYSGAENSAELTSAAARAEHAAKLAAARAGRLRAELELQVARAARPAESDQAKQAVTAAEAMLKQAAAQVDGLENKPPAEDEYTPLGEEFPKTSTGRRLALARWLVDRSNPRTARVCSNHIWMRHFGEPIVQTVDDFGMRGKPPTHPELLDWLSAELMDSAWSMKRLHRMIVTSEAFQRQSSGGSAENRTTDPENVYLWRTNSRRMEAEVVRDGVLFAAGRLDRSMGGPDIPEAQGQTSGRRSLYFRTTPDNKMQLLELFDLANPNECYRRRESVVPQQALVMTNSPLALNQARLLARDLADQIDDKKELVVTAFETILSRQPTTSEQDACLRFLARHETLLNNQKGLTPFAASATNALAPSTSPATRAIENLVHILFSHNDFVTIR